MWAYHLKTENVGLKKSGGAKLLSDTVRNVIQHELRWKFENVKVVCGIMCKQQNYNSNLL